MILACRFIPGSRTPTFITAGLLHRGVWKYIAVFFFSGAVWAPILVWGSRHIGGSLLERLEHYRTLTVVAAVAVAFLLWIALEWVVPLFTLRGRRLVLSKWRRRTRWEFWPAWILYAPLVPYILWLGLRHRCLTLFTACNPAMPHGGFVGESKSRILAGLAGAGDAVARWTLIPAAGNTEEKAAAVLAFLDRIGSGFPVVLKPDVGQRGLGVAILHDEAALRRHLAVPRPDLIAQEFVPGHEFGLFYYRHPDKPRGRLLAITDKQLLRVIGDGKSTLEQLILLDDRAVCMAPYFLHQHRDRLREVPPEGAHVPLGELGSHSRGALFRDGMWAHTDALEEAIDRISRTYEGFHFGRYDVRASSDEELKQGRGFRIIELNGVSSEATSIYDPAYSIDHARRVLRRQWRLAFSIGAAMRARGVRPSRLRDVLAALWRYRAAPEA